MRDHAYWRPRILVWSIVGYAMFYFVRKNLSVAMPVMEEQLGVNKEQLGIFLTMHGLLYGVSKFANGILGDRCSARWFMPVGLIGSAVLNIFFGFGAAVMWFGVIWMLNGWVQGMGFPPCARLMTHWFRPNELATKMSIWNMSHGIGTVAVLVICGPLVDRTQNWRLGFFVPAALAIVTAVLLLIFLRDTPASVGLPPVVEEPEGSTVLDERQNEPVGRTLVAYVFSNPYIWLFSLANFFVYVIRYAVLDWGPTMLKQTKGVTLTHATFMTAAFEIAGVIGALCAGWLTDKLFAGRAARTCVFCMLLCGIALFGFWRVPAGNKLLSTAMLMATGFFVYGPQALVGIAAANLGTKRAAAAAVGLTGLFGYASTIASGWGLGRLVRYHGWDRAFLAMFAAAAVGTALFLLAWRAPRDGYGVEAGAAEPAR